MDELTKLGANEAIDGAIWEQRENEPDLWFKRFDNYLKLGAYRSVEKAYKEDKVSKGKRPSRHWYDYARNFEWEVRARAWDEFERRRRLAEEEELRLKRRDERRKIEVLAKKYIADILGTISPDNVSPRDLALLMRTVFNEERIDLFDVPVMKTENTLRGSQDNPIEVNSRNANLNVNYDTGSIAEILAILDSAGALESGSDKSGDPEIK